MIKSSVYFTYKPANGLTMITNRCLLKGYFAKIIVLTANMGGKNAENSWFDFMYHTMSKPFLVPLHTTPAWNNSNIYSGV